LIVGNFSVNVLILSVVTISFGLWLKMFQHIAIMINIQTKWSSWRLTGGRDTTALYLCLEMRVHWNWPFRD